MAVLVVGGYGLLVVVARYGPKPQPTPVHGTITFTPDTVSCAHPVDFVERIWLPASINPSDIVGMRLNRGPVSGTAGVFAPYSQMADGSWESVTRITASSMAYYCTVPKQIGLPGRGPFDPGVHLVQLVYMDSEVVAEGFYTGT